LLVFRLARTDEYGDSKGTVGISFWGTAGCIVRDGGLYRGSDNSGQQFTSFSTKKTTN